LDAGATPSRRVEKPIAAGNAWAAAMRSRLFPFGDSVNDGRPFLGMDCVFFTRPGQRHGVRALAPDPKGVSSREGLTDGKGLRTSH
jgi:hypothetical protein